MNSEQYTKSKVKIFGKKIIFTKFEGFGYARKRSVPFLTYHAFACKLAGKNYGQMYGKLKMRLNVAQLHPSNLVNTIFCLVS